MSNTLRALTVPGEWYEKSVDIPPFKKIVGLSAGEAEILLPDSPRDYWYGGGYREGYSKSDIEELPLPLSEAIGQRLVAFFQEFLMKRQWRDIGRLAAAYDCHWIALWLKGEIDESKDTENSLDLAEEIMLQGRKVDLPISREEIGIIGGLSLSKAALFAEAHHSFVGLDETDALQATGVHGAIAIATQADTFKYFQETSWLSPRLASAGMNVFSRNNND